MTITEYRTSGGELPRLRKDVQRGNVAIIGSAVVIRGVSPEPDSAEPDPRQRHQRNLTPYQRRGFSFSILDKDTAEGRFAADIYKALTEQLGGDLTASQQLLVQCTALTALRCELLFRTVFATEGPSTDCNETHLIAWLNSLRRDLVALGLTARPMIDPNMTLSAFIEAAQRRAGSAT
jgi:hypothetical protein